MPARPHLIRLRGPWRCGDGTSPAGASPAGDSRSNRRVDGWRFRFPDQLVEMLQQVDGDPLVINRDFGLPTGLSPATKVVLAIDRDQQLGDCRLNGHPLALVRDADGVARCEVADLLSSRNLLQLEIRRPVPDQAFLPGEVQLEIIEPE